MPPNRTAGYEQAPLDDLLTILLRQFRRPLKTHGISLSDGDSAEIASAIVRRDPVSKPTHAIQKALRALITESESLLARWNLTFEQSLNTEMGDIPGWTTTSEFLDLANEKSNAELRISTGAALLVALGDYHYARYLLSLVERSSEDADLDEVIARRVLLFASGITPDDPALLAKLQAWVAAQQTD